ncbi:hypothetical protein LXL04_011797 [Taraxacum kok-saghyz]
MLRGNSEKNIDDTGMQRKKKKSKSEKNQTRRFSDEQIKSLESLFEMENKLEPRKKVEMATQLGLHPRQVAIWFQNRRARWKSKQVEHDYTSLKADYDSLAHRFESLKKEKHALIQQLRDVCNQLKEPYEGTKDLDNGSENEDTNLELNKGNSNGPMERDMAIYYVDQDDPCRKEESENLNVGVTDDQFSHEKGSSVDPSSLFYQSNWWDVWSSNS